jgi:hypothetical protein
MIPAPDTGRGQSRDRGASGTPRLSGMLLGLVMDVRINACRNSLSASWTRWRVTSRRISSALPSRVATVAGSEFRQRRHGPRAHPRRRRAVASIARSVPSEEAAPPEGPTPAGVPTEPRARREVELASVQDSMTTPHRRSLIGGAHSSSRLAPMTLTHRPDDEPHGRVGVSRGRLGRHSGGRRAPKLPTCGCWSPSSQHQQPARQSAGGLLSGGIWGLPTRAELRQYAPADERDSDVSASGTSSREGRGPSSATTWLVGRPPEAARQAVTSSVCGNGGTAKRSQALAGRSPRSSNSVFAVQSRS